jgi:hypothetical protein
MNRNNTYEKVKGYLQSNNKKRNAIPFAFPYTFKQAFHHPSNIGNFE